MSTKIKAFLGVVGFTALALWLQKLSYDRVDDVPVSAETSDDDDVAEIIKRARPALEHARRESEL